jgi:tetratricopeptide (TPR) repeat protein
MLEKHTKDLDKAKELFFSWKLHDAYAIFRRFFDRLPFSPQPEHALYLSYFIRCLLELGKERELNFYLNQIETLSSKWQTDELYYQLAEVSILGSKRNLTYAKEILTKVIANPDSSYLHTKAKMLLAYCYDCEGDNVDACRKIIDSIADSQDRPTQLNLELWRIKNLRDEGKVELAERKITVFFEGLDPILDWYAYFSGKIILGGLYLLRGDKEQAEKLLVETKAIVDKSPFKTLKAQISALEKKLNTTPITPELFCENGIQGWTIFCNDKRIELSYQTIPAKIFEVFTKKEWIDKSQLAKKIFKKEYEPASDDGRLHYQIHCLRKILLELDFDSDPISFEEGGYRLVPKVTIREGEV